MTEVLLRRDDSLGPNALAMIEESEAELASIYPAEVRYAFSPEQLTDAGVAFLVAYHDGLTVGCGGVAFYDGFAELKRIFVTKAARGARIAGQIVEGLEQIAVDAGLNLVRLETGEDSPEAIHLYERLGYARCGPFADYVENGSSVFMEKRLTGSA
ncbi:MAG: GNAT family N-acetyltransferase [Pseudomonadota bacterium]